MHLVSMAPRTDRLGFRSGASSVHTSRTMMLARIHLFVTDPAYTGRARVYFSNLESGGDSNVAIRNAFGNTRRSNLESQASWKVERGAVPDLLPTT